MNYLYVTYAFQDGMGSGLGRTILAMQRPVDREMTWSELQAIERKVLEGVRSDKPNVTSCFLADWRWLADEAPTPEQTGGE